MSPITFTNDEENQTYKLNPQIAIRLKEEYNLIVDKKLGEGFYSIVLKVHAEDRKEYALIINKNIYCETQNLVDKHYQMVLDLQTKGILNTEYVIQTYDPLVIKDIKLSNDIEYCPDVKNPNIYVEVEDLIDITLDEKIFKIAKSESLEGKIKFLFQIRDRILKMISYIETKGLFYKDLNSKNLAFLDRNDINSLIFIDVDSFENKEDFEKEQEEEEEKEERENRMLRNLRLDLFVELLSPRDEKEMNIEKYSEYKGARAHLFSLYELGNAFASILVYPEEKENFWI